MNIQIVIPPGGKGWQAGVRVAKRYQAHGEDVTLAMWDGERLLRSVTYAAMK